MTTTANQVPSGVCLSLLSLVYSLKAQASKTVISWDGGRDMSEGERERENEFKETGPGLFFAFYREVDCQGLESTN